MDAPRVGIAAPFGGGRGDAPLERRRAPRQRQGHGVRGLATARASSSRANVANAKLRVVQEDVEDLAVPGERGDEVRLEGAGRDAPEENASAVGGGGGQRARARDARAHAPRGRASWGCTEPRRRLRPVARGRQRRRPRRRPSASEAAEARGPRHREDPKAEPPTPRELEPRRDVSRGTTDATDAIAGGKNDRGASVARGREPAARARPNMRQDGPRVDDDTSESFRVCDRIDTVVVPEHPRVAVDAHSNTKWRRVCPAGSRSPSAHPDLPRPRWLSFRRAVALARARGEGDGKLAYVVFDNKTLQAVADARPNNLAALGRIKGVGPKKLIGLRRGGARDRRRGRRGRRREGVRPQSRGGTPAGSSSAAAAAAALFGSASRRPPPSNASSGATASAIATAFATASDSTSASPSASATTTTTSISYETAKHNYETKMNPEQRAVVDAVLAGENVFFHGAAGIGKVLRAPDGGRALVRGAGRGGDDSLVSSPAPTGIAAVGVGGVTVHKFIGAGLCAGHLESRRAGGQEQDCDAAVERHKDAGGGRGEHARRRSAREARPRREIDARGVRCSLRRTSARLHGDFYQLPPVANAATTPRRLRLRRARGRWRSFASSSWSPCFDNADPRLVNALNDVRRGFVPVGGAASTLFRG